MILAEGPTTFADDRWLQRLNRPDGGVIAVLARPVNASLWQAISTPLEALGKARPEPGGGPRDRELLVVWLAAYGIRDLLIHHAEVYPDAVILRTLDAAAREAGAHLWAIVEPAYLQITAAALADSVERRIDWAALRTEWSAREVPPPGAPDPAIPLRAETAWRAEEARIDAELGRRGMDTAYLVGFCEAAGWPRDRQSSKRVLTGRLRGLAERFDDRACVASAMRGAAVALREYGWAIDLDLARLAGGPGSGPLRRHGRSMEVADLRRFRDPLTAGVGVLANLELAPDEVLGLRVGDVADDGSSLRLRTSAAPVPRIGRPLVRALLISRLRAGATATDYLLADETGPLTAASFASIAFAALETIGAWLPWREVDDHPAEDERWLLDRGIIVGWLARTERDDAWRRRLVPPADVMAEILERLLEEAVPSVPRCACARDHAAPDAAALPVWPTPHRHEPAGPSHPWRRGTALGEGRTRG